MGSACHSRHWHFYGDARLIHRKYQPSYHRTLFWRPLERRRRMGDYSLSGCHCRSSFDGRTPGRPDRAQTDLGCRPYYLHYRLRYLRRVRLPGHVDCRASITGLRWRVHHGHQPGYAHGRALGINAVFVALGVSVGPTLGGIITENLTCRWIFYVNVPLGIIGVIATLSVLKEA